MSRKVGGDEAGEGSTPKKRLKTRSKVWDHFTKTDDGTAAICKYCNNDFSIKYGTTTHLSRHLRSCDQFPDRTIPRPSTIAGNNKRVAMEIPSTTTCVAEITKFGSTQAPPAIASEDDEVGKFRFNQEMIREIQVKNAILADFPFAPPNVKMAWSSLMMMDMEKEICAYHQQEKEKLLAELEGLTSRICFTFKIMKEAGWISITAHFINSDFNLVKKLISFKKLPDVSSNLHDEVASIIDSCISDWKLENKIFTFTTEDFRLYYALEEKFKEKMLLDWIEMSPPCFKEMVGCDFYYCLQYRCHNETNKIKKFVVDVLQDEEKKRRFNEIARENGLPPVNNDWLKGPLIEWEWDEYADQWKHCCAVVKTFKDTLLYKEVFVQYALTIIDEEHFSGIDWPKLEREVESFEETNHIIDQLFNFKYPTFDLPFQSRIEVFKVVMRSYEYGELLVIIYVAGILDPRYKLRFIEYFHKKEDLLCWNEEFDSIRDLFERLLQGYATKETNEPSPVSPGTANTQEVSFPRSSANQNAATIDNFALYIKQLKTSGKFEMEQYLAEETVDIGDVHFDLLGWWKENKLRYPVLSRRARDVLAMPLCVYSVEENLKLDLGILRGVNPELVEAAVCSKDWILSDVSSTQEIGQSRNDQQPLIFATTNDHIHINSHNSGEKTINRDNTQNNCDVPHPNKVPEEIIGILENNQEASRTQSTQHKQFNSKSAPEEDEEITKTAMHQFREKLQGKKILYDKFGLGLNREEILAVELVDQIEPTAVIVKMGANRDNYVRLTSKEMNCLVLPPSQDGTARWLVDEVIDAYINIINHQSDRPGNVIIVSTLDTQLLRGDLSACKTTSKIEELGTKFLNNDLIFFPINNGGVHWIVGALNLTRCEFQILDSKLMNYNAANQNYDKLTCELFLGIQRCIQSVLVLNEAMLARSNQFDVARMSIVIIQTAPQQTDLSSCGLFALKYMQFWDGSNFLTDMISFSQMNMEIFRKKIVAQLIMSELNLMKVIPQEIRKLLNEVLL